SLFLLLSLFVFGMAFLVDRTVLNPNFITSELNKLEIAPLVEEFIAQQLPQEFPEELKDELTATISKLEPQLKEEVHTAVYSVYDYLLGKQETPDLAKILRGTFLSSDFIVSVIDELDINSLAKPIIQEQLIDIIPAEMQVSHQGLDDYLEELLVDLEPWIKEQARTIVDPIAGYLVGETESFSVTISTEPAVDKLKDTLTKETLESISPQFAGMSSTIVEGMFDQLIKEIPASLEIDENMIGKDLPAQIASSLAEAEATLVQPREIIGYFQLGYILLIVFIILLIAGIVLIHREVKGTTRNLGITFLVFGAVELAVILIAKHFASDQLGEVMLEVPTQLQLWVHQLLDDLVTPILILCGGFVIIGIALVVVSFVYKRSEYVY
ncbi:hypothetical protein ACFLV5_03975, partial [Chloroflexota bacterium]